MTGSDGLEPVKQVQTSASAASTASEYGYPHGHLTHLGGFESGAFVQFKKLLGEKGMYKPGPPPSHDDALLLRFLRARRWIPEEAYEQFKATEEWRGANDIDVLYHTIDLDAYEHSRRMYPQWTGRRDRRGIPLYVFEIKTLDSKTVANYEKTGASTTFSKAKTDGKTPPGLLRLFALYENLTHFIFPFCSQLKDREWEGTPVTMSTNIVDVSGVGIKQFWNLKSHMQAASQLATAHYPETLDRIFVIGAPIFFSTVWGWIKRWFDPITVSKIFILSHDEVLPTLTKFVDPKNIPKQYGGQLEFSFGQLPPPDPAWEGIVQWDNGHKSFPSGPHVWRDAEGGRMECIGIGSVDGKERRERICTIPRNYRWVEAVEEDTAREAEVEAGTEPAAPPAEGEPTKAASEAIKPEDLADKVDKVAISEPAQQNGKPVEANEKSPTSLPPALPTTVA